jgi:tetratricopeptide (TPR) repeat protein
MRAYSTRQVAGLVGESQQRVRAAARAGIVSPSKTSRGRLRFSFQDLVFLRSAKALEKRAVDVRRIWRALRALRAALPAERPLSSVRVICANRRIFVRDANTSWEPESGQALFDFATIDSPSSTNGAEPQPNTATVVTTHSADYWFARGLKLDRQGIDDDAMHAYCRAIDIDADCVDARINLGRLLHTARRHSEAEACYRAALELEPSHAIAAFNLGVVLEDQGANDAAIEQYSNALELDPSLPDAHYNLARLYGWRGDLERAARHLARFRALSNDDQ